jgi:hypothetical protein
MMLSLMEIGQNIQNIMRALEMIIKIVAAAVSFAKKNGREMFLINISN